MLILICVGLYLKMQPGPPDRATNASSEENLAKQTLETNLPKLAEVPTGNGSINDLFRVVGESQNVLRAGGHEAAKKEAAAKVIASLKGAAASSMAEGLLDKRIPAKRFDAPKVKGDLQAVGAAVKIYKDQQLEAFTFEPARQAAYAQVLLGKQIFEKNTRLKTRQSGLAVMRSGLSNMLAIEQAAFQDGEINQEKLLEKNESIMAWLDAVKKIEEAWNAKLKTTEGIASSERIPNTGDLKQIALKDKDPTFRIWAARRMGYALYERGDMGNQEMLKKTIDELIAGSDKAVAEAAKDGKAIKGRDEYHELRK